MNTRSAIENSISPSALSVAFNQDASCFSVGQESGFSVFDSDPCRARVSRDFGAGISVVQMVGKSNFIGMVGGGKHPKFSQSKVIVWDDAKRKVVLQIPTPTIALGVRISKTHIVIILQNSVRAYKFKTPLKIWHAFETTDNFLGLCCLDSNTLAFPGRTPGQVQLVNLTTGSVSIIPAHGSSLRALVLSQNGQILATASETGTLIRVFATHNCARIVELRRGVDPAVIFSLAISPSGLLLAATSDKSTLHIFDIPNFYKSPLTINTDDDSQNILENSRNFSGQTQAGNDVNKKWGFLGKIPMLPRMFSDNYSFASVQFENEDTCNLSRSELRFKSPKGVIGWINDETIIVIGAGSDPKWEKFIIIKNADGRRYCLRDGWKNYLVGC
ncbi:SVP1-like protein 2 [Erysiphe neolycopersici]|uniref:SVP1-like protein 2 n=1 Tax=Erysiphe neolycopersici TaxID=212602 RepID=A0A420HX01_9PEZI|nr:SVP1-like protein 2 [Erysiphe neolycopersici]